MPAESDSEETEYNVAQRSGNRRFRPGLWPTLAALAGVSLTCGLGNWQLERAAQKRALYASFDAAGQVSGASPVDEVGADSAAFEPVTAWGRYDAGHQLLLDAMLHEGQAGYQVLTPLLREGKPAVLVNRGWIATGADRSALPALPVSGDERRVTGLRGRLPRPAMRLEAAADAAGWPRVALYPTREQVQAMLGYPVLETVLLLSPDEPDGYLRDWRPQLLSPEKHLGYAAQWFAMALAIIVIYLAVNWRRPEETEDE